MRLGTARRRSCLRAPMIEPLYVVTWYLHDLDRRA